MRIIYIDDIQKKYIKSEQLKDITALNFKFIGM